MNKYPVFLACLIGAVLLTAVVCGASASSIGVIGGADGPTAVFVATASASDSDNDETASPSPSPSPIPTAAPVENADFIIDAQIGYEGYLVMTRWMPTFVTVTNEGADFDGLLAVNVFMNQTEYDRYEMPLTLAAGATKKVVLPIRPQTRQDTYAFELLTNGTIVAEKRVDPGRPVAPETVAIGVLSQTPEQFAFLNQRSGGLNTLRGEVWLTMPLSPDTFPETADLMGSLAMLVIDGIDVRTLSGEQQEALMGWLLKGGIVFVSGGAKAVSGYPFFAQWTDVLPADLAQGEDITLQLLEYATIRGTAVDESIWRNTLPATDALMKTAEGDGIINQYRAGEGVIFLSSFDMGSEPLSNWGPMANIWPRILRQSMPREYDKMVSRIQEYRYGGNDQWQAQTILDHLRVPNTESGIPVVLILVAYLLLVGFGGYILLKKIDRREWLWFAAPMAAVVFAVLLLLLSQGSTMNKPVALTASRVILDGDNAQTSTYIGVATPNRDELMITTDQHQLVNVLASDNYWYDDSMQADRLYRPIDLRQRYRFGSDPGVGFSPGEAWKVKMLQLSGMEQHVGAVEASIWMEADGMHGEATNKTAHQIKDCFIATPFGFALLGDMIPGASAPFEMLYPTEKIDQSQDDFKYKPNILYSTLDLDPAAMQGGYYYTSVDTYVYAALFGDNQYDEDPIAQQRSALIQLFTNDWSFSENQAGFYFFGFNDSLGRVQVTLNEAPVTRGAHIAAIGTRVTFEPIGPTGEVMFPQGAIPAEIVVDQGADLKPRLPTEEDAQVNTNDSMYRSSTTYLSLANPGAIRFMLPEWDTYTIERMTLSGQTYGSLPELFLYNNQTETWDAQLLLTVSMDGAQWAPYIDEEGGIYARYVPADTAGRYEEMSMPTIALKGEVK